MTYTEEFYCPHHDAIYPWRKNNKQKKYISSLKYPIQKCVILYNIFSVDEVYNKAMKIERLQNRATPFKSLAEKDPAV